MTTLNSSKSTQTSLQINDPALITQLIKNAMTSAPHVVLKAGSQYNACVNAGRPFHTMPPKILLCHSAMLLNIPYYASYLHLRNSKMNASVNSNMENVTESSKGNQLLNTFCIVHYLCFY